MICNSSRPISRAVNCDHRLAERGAFYSFFPPPQRAQSALAQCLVDKLSNYVAPALFFVPRKVADLAQIVHEKFGHT